MTKLKDEMQQLFEIMESLRNPNHGCPWDKQQTLHTLIPHSIEEVYELADAIENNDYEEIKNELGDLLFHIIFYAQITKEENRFEFKDVANAVSEKLIRRHPHVFGDLRTNSVDTVNKNWEKIKTEERMANASKEEVSYIDGIAQALPAMIRAQKIQKRVAAVGFDWETIEQVADKVDEELLEVRAVLKDCQHKGYTNKTLYSCDDLAEELGDLLFSCINLVRFAGLNAESVLRQANQKFVDRFQQLEHELTKAGKELESAEVEELNQLWEKVKNKANN